MSSNLELGSTVECNQWWHLSSIFFPSKIGGKPAWLSPSGVPIDDLRCNVCERPFTFLLQVYAPGPSEESQAFHRTMFIFMCPNANCHNKFNSQLGSVSGKLKPRIPFRVLRCQLARENPFYSNVPVSENISESEAFPLIASLYKSPAISNGHSNSSGTLPLLTKKLVNSYKYKYSNNFSYAQIPPNPLLKTLQRAIQPQMVFLPRLRHLTFLSVFLAICVGFRCATLNAVENAVPPPTAVGSIRSAIGHLTNLFAITRVCFHFFSIPTFILPLLFFTILILHSFFRRERIVCLQGTTGRTVARSIARV